jgi:hypothetical protein
VEVRLTCDRSNVDPQNVGQIFVHGSSFLSSRPPPSLALSPISSLPFDSPPCFISFPLAVLPHAPWASADLPSLPRTPTTSTTRPAVSRGRVGTPLLVSQYFSGVSCPSNVMILNLSHVDARSYCKSEAHVRWIDLYSS